MDYTIIFIVAIVVILVIANAIIDRKQAGMSGKEEKTNKSPYHYKRRDFLMSRAEHEFFDVLAEAVKAQYYIFPQVHLATILDHKVVGQNWKGAFRHIDEKSVDFVLCDKAYIKPLLAIELDDRTHDNDKRKERDGVVESILGEAVLPLLRFENHGHFDKADITQRIANALVVK